MQENKKLMPIYTVIGIYADNQQRYAEAFEAESPERAERMALKAVWVRELFS
jgi:hypothetical protein